MAGRRLGAALEHERQKPALAVNKKGEAMVTYTMANGKLRHVLVWGAVNANLPSATTPQVRFKYDYAGGYGKYHNGNYWKTFVKSQCGTYDGPALPMMVVACKAPDGSYWALQSWQRELPHLGFAPVAPGAERLGAAALALDGCARAR